MQVPNRNLIPFIKNILESGQNVRLSVHGSSMLPHIKNGDTVELTSIKSTLKKGDIVLAQSSGDRHVLHRIIKVNHKSIYLRGDSQEESEGPISTENVLGRAVSLQKCNSSHSYSLDSWHMYISGLIWICFSPYGARLLRLFVTAYNRYISNK